MARSEFSPGPLIQISGAYWRSCALQAGTVLDVFTALGDASRSADELAAKLGCQPRALGVLLDALTAMGLLAKRGEAYANTPESREFLCTDSPRYAGFIIRHHHHLMSSWSRLADTVRTGQPARQGAGRSEGDRRDFLMGMFNMAMGIAPTMAKLLPLTGRKRVLDLGGGPGTYAIHFCLAHPGLTAAVFDLPDSEPFARATAERFGVADRIEFLPGDYFQDPIPGRYDLVWLSQILHAESPERCQALTAKAARTLHPGGIIAVHEFLLNDAKDGPEHPALFSLNMLLGTDGGRSYSDAEVRDMLAQAGAKDIKRLEFEGPNDSGVIYGVMS